MLLSYTRQVALGMMHLMNKCYVHRDLAARNILVSGDGMVCKVIKCVYNIIKYPATAAVSA
jgi:serine/threonine protein kinase